MTSLQIKEEIARLRKTQLLPWIADPFTKCGHSGHEDPASHMPASDNKALNSNEDVIETMGRPTSRQRLEEAEEIEEATPIELFYDLFFVANLTTVTSVHYITEWKTLSSYILFFIILWFTWLHVTLLDVRFSVDSVYERVCKTLHFAAMAGFSSVSTAWDPFSPDDNTTATALKAMTLTLAFSRCILAMQYFIVMGFGWSKKQKTAVPLAIHGAVMVVSAVVYLGLFFDFGPGHTARSYLAWYIMAFFEVGAVIATSSIWRTVSFKKTHLVERMGLLTLIILGEGIIVMLKAINSIVRGFGWTGSTVGVVISALLIIYFYWMFYFDYNPRNVHYGSIRQQLWCLLHFPFHLAIVLSVEGLRQLATLHSFELMAKSTEDPSTSPAPLSPKEMAAFFKEVFDTFYNDGSAKTVLKNYSEIINSIDLLSKTANRSDEYYSYSTLLLDKFYTSLAEFYGIKAPYATGNLQDDFMAIVHVSDLVYQYFFIALGIIFVIYGIFAVIVRRHMDIFDYISITLRFAVAGVFFGMVGLFLSPTRFDSFDKYLTSPWPIPQVCLILFTILVVDKTIAYFALRRVCLSQ